MKKILDKLLAKIGLMRVGYHRVSVLALEAQLRGYRRELRETKAELAKVKNDRHAYARIGVKALNEANELLKERKR